jgi:Mn2+/Fe2+ NRAMP family transporter
MPIPEPPRGLRRIQALGPGFLWMVSAAGSSELLFTPRVGALYSYALLWAMVAAVSLKWVINREIGRFAVGTGTPILEGFATLPGPKNWAVWVILVPQAVVAVSALAGMAGAAATALTLVLPGPVQLWMTASLLASTALVLFGRYRAIEIVATVIGVALGVAALVAASGTAPSLASVAEGLVPALPANVNYAEILPWLGFMLSGAAGMMWYSYWVVEKGYGGAAHERGASEGPDAERRLQGWLRQMTFDNTVAVVGTFVVTGAFLVLGAEILGPKQLVPEEDRVAAVLGELLGERFGRIGFWFMVAAVFVGFWDTLLSDQDGHARLFTNGTRLLFARRETQHRALEPKTLRRIFVVVLTAALPLAVYLAVGEPVALLKIAGAIEAIHIPIVTALALYLNRTRLPRALRPSAVTFAAAVLAGAFFLVFAALYLRGLV